MDDDDDENDNDDDDGQHNSIVFGHLAICSDAAFEVRGDDGIQLILCSINNVRGPSMDVWFPVLDVFENRQHPEVDFTDFGCASLFLAQMS